MGALICGILALATAVLSFLAVTTMIRSNRRLRADRDAFCRLLDRAIELSETAQADAARAGEVEAERALGRLVDDLRVITKEIRP